MEFIMKAITTLAALAAFTFSTLTFASPVNINTANAEQIAESLTGIGMVKAQAIIDYRDTNGLFSSADQIVLVRGIGDATFNANEADILVK
ncbi:MAG: helix-hairpin-helix domain-containing protein [Proteobacteria bacterium]|nr:helix-hairpin-helix domain-containing protein [Pseudomonadota bacterium]